MKQPSRLFAAGSALLTLTPFATREGGAFVAPFVFVALVPLLLRLAEPDVRPFRCGYGFGLLYGLGQLFWIGQLTYRWTGNAGLSVVPLLAAVPLFAVYYGLAGWLICRCWRLGLPWLIPVVWAGIEVFRSYIPVLAFPWGILAAPLWHFPALIQSAHYLTIYGVSALATAVNVILCLLLIEAERRRHAERAQPPRRGWRWMLAVVVLAVLGPWTRTLIPATGPPMRVTAGQLGVDLAFGDRSRETGLVRASVDRLESDAIAQKSQLLVLPEGLIFAASTFPPNPPFEIPPNLPLVFGAQRGEGVTYQSAFAYDGRWSVADKTRLVIFGEFVPRWIPFLDGFHLAESDLSAGTRVQALQVSGVTLGPLLCFEGLFPDLGYRQTLNGAQLLAVMSMDDWFIGTWAPEQLRGASVWRAVETGLPIVRAATTGYSMICDGNGAVLGELPLREGAALTREVRLSRGGPAWWLPVFPLLSLLGCVFLAVTRPSAPQLAHAT